MLVQSGFSVEELLGNPVSGEHFELGSARLVVLVRASNPLRERIATFRRGLGGGRRLATVSTDTLSPTAPDPTSTPFSSSSTGSPPPRC